MIYKDNNIKHIIFCEKPTFFSNHEKEKAFLNDDFLITNTRKCIKSCLYNNLDYRGNPYGADTVLLAKILLKANDILFIPDILFNVDKTFVSLSRKKKNNNEWKAICEMHLELCNYLLCGYVYQTLLHAMAHRTFMYFKFYLSQFRIKNRKGNLLLAKKIRIILPYIGKSRFNKSFVICKFPNLYSFLRSIFLFFTNNN